MLNFDKQFIRMKKLITSLLSSIVLCFIAESQTANDDYFLPKPKETVSDKISVSITAGTALGFINSSKSTIYSSFIAPQIGYKLSPEFKLNIGMIHSTAYGHIFTQNPADYKNYTPGSLQNNFSAAALGLEYRISSRSSIGISTIIGQGNSNYNMNFMPGNSPFANDMYPFGAFSPFGR